MEKDVESRIEAILERLPDGFIALDREGRCSYINTEALRLLGRSRAELLGRDCAALFPNGSALLRQELTRAAAEQVSVELQEYDEASDRWMEVRGCAAPDGGLSICLRDVTDRVRAEQELRRSQRELTDFLENATEGLHWVGPDRTILWANQAELDLLGYSREEYLGRSIKEFHVDQPVVDDMLYRLVTGESLDNREARLRCKDGSIRYVLISSSALAFEGQFIHSRCFTRDITDRKRAEEGLQASRQLFGRFMENLPGLAWIKDLNGRYLYANAAATELLGRSPAALRGLEDRDLFSAVSASGCGENERRDLDDARGVATVAAWEHPDGLLHHFLVSRFPVLDPNGAVAAIGGIAIDVTERTRAEEALRTADRRKDEFLAMLAHELRNPLAPIMTAVEILRIHGPKDAVLEKQRGVIDRQVKQMKRLLDDLLDVSRITRGTVEVEKLGVDLRAVLKQAVETSRPLLDERGHELRVSLPGAALRVAGDAVRLSQVFTNLLNNAARYTPPRGTIWLTAKRNGDAASVLVRDNGIGMTPEVLAEAFELFTQGERSLARSEGGLGIGLTLVRELVELHDGTVTARSAGLGSGSELHVTLPLLSASKAGAAAAPIKKRISVRRTTLPPGRRILVVDDNPDQVEGMAQVLVEEGYEVYTAYDGESALGAARAHRPHLGLLDIGLPKMDGYALARALRKEPTLARMKLIALTGYGRDEDLCAAREAGFDHHFTKPVEIHQLLNLLADVILGYTNS
ncbi:MAG: PAS domain S-box protein [Actinomycetota bacterium]